MEPNTLQTSVNETDNKNSSEQLLQIEKIEDSPFTAIKKEEKWYLMMGKYRLNDTPFNTLEETIQDAKDASWFRIMQVIGIMIDDQKTQLNQK